MAVSCRADVATAQACATEAARYGAPESLFLLGIEWRPLESFRRVERAQRVYPLPLWKALAILLSPLYCGPKIIQNPACGQSEGWRSAAVTASIDLRLDGPWL